MSSEIFLSAECSALSLQDACRIKIRRLLRAKINQLYPDLDHRRRPSGGPPQKRRRSREKSLNIGPMNITMMIPRLVNDSDEDAGTIEEEGPDFTGNGADRAGQAVQDEENDNNSDGRRLRRRGRFQVPTLEEESESEDSDLEDAPGMPEILRQMAAMQRRFLEITRREIRAERLPTQEEDAGLGEELDDSDAAAAAGAAAAVFSKTTDQEEEEPQEDLLLNKSSDESSNPRKGSNTSSSTSGDEMEVDPVPVKGNNVSNAIPIVPSSGRNRCSSSTSVSTSATSGIGTCSSVEEPTEMDFIKELEDEEEVRPSSSVNSYTTALTSPEPFSASCPPLPADSSTESSCHVQEYEEEDAESTECYSNCLPSSKDKHCSSDNDKSHSAESQCSYSRVMLEHIELLPIPLALKQFLGFYRT